MVFFQIPPFEYIETKTERTLNSRPDVIRYEAEYYEAAATELKIWLEVGKFINLSAVTKRDFRAPSYSKLHQIGDKEIYCSWTNANGFSEKASAGVRLAELGLLMPDVIDLGVHNLLNDYAKILAIVNAFTTSEVGAQPFPLEVEYGPNMGYKEDLKCWTRQAEIPSISLDSSES